MITLVPMTEDEYQAYCDRSIAEYAEEHVRAGRWTAEEAYEQARKQYEGLLPNGIATPDQYVNTIRDSENTAVGMLWFAKQEQGGEPSAFIYDVAIYPEFRRKGYATEAFQALEKRVRELGLSSIRLHVFGHNHEARALYEKLGFEPTNILMAKKLTAPEE